LRSFITMLLYSLMCLLL